MQYNTGAYPLFQVRGGRKVKGSVGPNYRHRMLHCNDILSSCMQKSCSNMFAAFRRSNAGSASSKYETNKTP